MSPGVHLTCFYTIQCFSHAYTYLQHSVPPHVDQKLPGCSVMQIGVQSSYFTLTVAPMSPNYSQKPNKLAFCVCPC